MFLPRYRIIVNRSYNRKTQIIILTTALVTMSVIVVKLSGNAEHENSSKDPDHLASITTKATNHIDVVNNKFSEYQCWMSKQCKRDGTEICGLDDTHGIEYAIFEDYCAVYIVNCKLKTKYSIVNMELCVAKSKPISDKVPHRTKTKKNTTKTLPKMKIEKNTRATKSFKPIPKIQIILGVPNKYYI